MDPFAKRQLGSSRLEVEQLSFGAGPLGDMWALHDDRNAEDVIRTAYDAGLRYFDTSPLYGYGLSEYRVGHALRQLPRDSFVVSTKVGRCLKPEAPALIDRGNWTGGLNFAPVFDYSYDGVMRSVEHSHHRLAMHRLDILLIHDADVQTHGDAADEVFKTVMDGGYRALEELRGSGDVKAIGVGVNESETCARFARAGDFDCMLLAGRYTLFEQGAVDTFLPLAVEKNIGIILGGAFNSGILVTGAGAAARYDYEPAPETVQARVRRIEAICRSHDVPLGAAAIQFPLGHPAVSTVCIGMGRSERIQQNIDLMRRAIPSELWEELRAEELLHVEAPVPA